MISSVVSIVPLEIKFKGSGSHWSGDYVMPKSNTIIPQILYIDDAKGRMYLGAERGFMEMKITSDVLSVNMVKDYITSCISSSPNAHPGIFAIPFKEIKIPEKECASELSVAKIAQGLWFDELIKDADSDWARFGHSHRTISELQREIARMRHLDKEWMQVTGESPFNTKKCPACFADIEVASVICRHCRLILRPEEHKKMQFVEV